MKFEDALAAMREGKKVKLPDWAQQFYQIRVTLVDRCNSEADITANEVISEEWEVVNEESKN